MIVKLLIEHHLEFLSLTGGSTCSSESTLVKISNCWKKRVMAYYYKIQSLVVSFDSVNSTFQVSLEMLLYKYSHLGINIT